MNALQKAKLLKQLKEVNESKATLSGVAKAKALKLIIELRSQLGLTSKANQPKSITYDLGMSNRGGGLGVYARNVKENGDYATLVTLSGVTHLRDGMTIDLDMNSKFKNENAISQVKAFLRETNPNILFADENNHDAPTEFEDDNLYTLEQVREAFKTFEGGKHSDAEVSAVIGWATKKGYMIRPSITQVHWTDEGIEWAKLNDNAALDPETSELENVPEGSAYFQSVINGERTLSIETLQGMLNEAEQNPEDALLVPATQVLVDQYNAALV